MPYPKRLWLETRQIDKEIEAANFESKTDEIKDNNRRRRKIARCVSVCRWRRVEQSAVRDIDHWIK